MSETENEWKAALDVASSTYEDAVRAVKKAIDAQANVHFAESRHASATGDKRAAEAAHKKGMFVARTSASEVVRSAVDTGLGRRIFGLS